MLWSFGSLSRSAESSTTVLSPRFFHQCEMPLVSATTSPALCTIGTAQLLAYSSISTFDDVDDRRPLAVAVPGHDAAGLDHELAHAQAAILDALLLVHVDRGDDCVGDADRLQVDGLAHIGLGLVGGAFAGLRGGNGEACAGDDAGKQGIAAEPAFLFEQEHLRFSFWLGRRPKGTAAVDARRIGPTPV